MTENSKEKREWMDAVWNVISESLSRKKSLRPPVLYIQSFNFNTVK